MKDYIEIIFEEGSAENELLLAALAAKGYEGFDQSKEGLKAYIPKDEFDELDLDTIAEQHRVGFSMQLIHAANWNAQWESGFDPVVVDGRVAIRAHFHPPVENVQYEIIITPKMSFGTGHHATTHLMVSAMCQLELKNKKVFDFGTGTGVLAILAEKLGAAKVKAIDIDEWSIENAQENAGNNGCSRIELELADRPDGETGYEVILANINRNIILENLTLLSQMSRPRGIILLSGLLAGDESTVTEAAISLGLHPSQKNIRGNWLLLQFSC